MTPEWEERQMKDDEARAGAQAKTPSPRAAGSKAAQPMLRDAETSMKGLTTDEAGFLPPRRTP